ncbi:Centrosomal protein of 135 kDa [Trichoplax sp. H2]|nr:Centrosomal protein of 135 kDa [Trichoplax sp. H2]|eukprot:RDD46752.1 Centrosomal protein of 135 kDa [Trichoplax sp. H2]
MSTAAERKFTKLRRRLDQLGYRQLLGVDSVPLVEKLFADLLHTTESLKNAKTELSQRQVEKGNWERIIEPYKRDNGRLMKENNSIHLQLIKVKEESELTIRDLKETVRHLEHENADLRFLNTQYAHKIKSLEHATEIKTDRIQQLQERNFQAVVETPGGRKRHIPHRRQRMDIDATIDPSDDRAYGYNNHDAISDPYIADLLHVADGRIEKLQTEVDLLKDEQNSNDRRIKSLRKQIDVRDKEIERLSKLLSDGRPVEAVIDETKKDSNERIISHLNVQVNFLQDANRELENKLDDTISAKTSLEKENRNLSKRNDDLCNELKDIDRLSKQLEQDKDETIADCHREIADIQNDLRANIKAREELSDKYNELREHIQSLEAENTQLTELVAISERESKKSASVLDKVQVNNQTLSNKCEKLSNIERDLTNEIDRLRQRNTVKTHSLTKILEEERDHYKKECLTLQNLLKQKDRISTSEILSGPSEDTKNHNEMTIRVLERERDYYRDECDNLRSLLKAEGKNLPKKSLREKQISAKESEVVKRLRQERDELKTVLKNFEKNLNEIQNNVKDLAHDRDSTTLLYKQAQEELQRLRRESILSPNGVSSNKSLVLKRIEEERDDAIQELEAAKTERNSLRERLKVSSESVAVDRKFLEQKADAAINSLTDAERQKSELRSQLSSAREMISHLEEQVKNSTLSLTMAREDVVEQKSQSSKYRLLLDQAERSIEEYQNKLSSKISELQAAEKKINRLEEKIGEVKKQSSACKDEVKRLRSVLSSLDRDRDSLQNEVDKKAELMDTLEGDKKQILERSKQLESTVEELESRLSLVNEQLSRKDREIQSLKRQINDSADEVNQLHHGHEQSHKENRRLHEDLAIMTEENQALHEELERNATECSELKLQVQEYARQASRVQELLEIKDQEKAELLEQFRILSNEKEQIDSTARQTISESANMRAQMAARDEQYYLAREVTEQQEKELERHKLAQQSYEMQLSSMAQSLSNMEEQLRVAQEEKESLLKDVSTIRELYLKLEDQNEDLGRRLMSQSMDNEQLQVMFDAKKHEAEALRHQVFTEKGTSRNLEQLIASSREKDFRLEQKLKPDWEESDTKFTEKRYNYDPSSDDNENGELAKTNFEKDESIYTERYGHGLSVSRDIKGDQNAFVKSDETTSPDYDIRVISPLS